MDDSTKDFASERRYQRRPDLSASSAIPQHLAEMLRTWLDESSAHSMRNDTEQSVSDVLRKLADATTPESQLRLVSSVVTLLQPSGRTGEEQKKECTEDFLAAVAKNWIFPWLLECRVRYAHKVLVGVARQLVQRNRGRFQPIFDSLLVEAHVQPTSFTICPNEASLRGFGSWKDDVMHFTNCLDALTVTVVPVFREVFENRFVEMLPKLGEAACWALDNAMFNRKRRAPVISATAEVETSSPDGEGGSVFGEDLDLIRFCVRVVATHVHKFLYVIHEHVKQGSRACGNDNSTTRSIVDGIGSVLFAAVRMLCSPSLPKDVLNAAGLLFASILTVKDVDAGLLLRVCKFACTGSGCGNDQCVTLSQTREYALELLLGAATTTTTATASAEGLCDLVKQFTDNGRFAFFKGLLSHFNGPVHGNLSSIATLLTPVDGQEVIADVIMPNAELFTAEMQSPDTRFMAIQTMDSVVRHLASVFKELADRAAKDGPDSLPGELINALCTPTAKLQRTVDTTVKVVMSLWDDPTQQVSGPLYATYSVVLSIDAELKRCKALLASRLASANEQHSLLDPRTALLSVLATQNDRRGKYHALLALVDVLDVTELKDAFAGHFIFGHHDTSDTNTQASTALRGLRAFCAMLIGGSSNSKICSVCGEVLAAMAKKVLTSAEGSDDEFAFCFMRPIAAASLWYHSEAPKCVGGLNVTPAMAVSNVIAHMVTPLLKRWPTVTLNALLSAVKDLISEMEQRGSSSLGSSASSHPERSFAVQAVVEVLYRARTSGIDITPYIAEITGSSAGGSSSVFVLVCEAMQSYDFDLRNSALGLCILSLKGAEQVTRWQCATAIRFLALNIHLGGDSTARNQLIQTYKKWTKRLVDSMLSSKCRTGVPADSRKQNKDKDTKRAKEDVEREWDAYVDCVFSHCESFVALLTAHAGLSPSAATTSNLSVERRYTALTLISHMVQSILPVLTSPENSANVVGALVRVRGGDPSSTVAHVVARLLPSRLVAVLTQTLGEGWDRIRNVAVDLLKCFTLHNCDAVFPAPVVQGIDAYYHRGWEQLRSSLFRVTEGGVQMVLLALHGRKVFNVPSAAPLPLLLQVQTDLLKRCAETEKLPSYDAYKSLHASPFHGSMTLVGALLSAAAADVKSRQAAAAASDGVLKCAQAVLRVCTALVSGYAVDTSDANDEEGPACVSTETKVDCRGHIYRSEGDSMEAESFSRTVVNNSWLGIRSATSVIEKAIGLFSIESFDSAVSLRETAHCLVDTLLKTKHNGVMSKSRQALKVMCTALLRAKNPAYYELPAELVYDLLGEHGVTSSSEARVLRRSQGLPHALLPVLEAEDPSVPFYLFPLTMKFLIAVANEESPRLPTSTAAETVPLAASLTTAHRVNALNVLKFIFDNSTFAGRIVPFIQDAFLIAIAGFRHQNWAVRNSSLMLFSSVLHRFIGDHPSTGGGGVNTSFHDVAFRIPRGIQFVLEELRKAVEETEHSNRVQPALFPMLLMLSMLSPDAPHMLTNASGLGGQQAAAPGGSVTAAEENKERDDSDVAMELILRCRGTKNLMARGASAGALTSLVSVANVCDVLLGIGESIAVTEPSSSRLDMNAIHGALLHAQRFFAHYVGTLRTDAKVRISPYYSAQLSLKVLDSTVMLLARCRYRLAEVVTRCPTLAALHFSLLSDVLYFWRIAALVESREWRNRTEPPLCCAASAAAQNASDIVTAQPVQQAELNADVVMERSSIALFLVMCSSMFVAQHPASEALWKAEDEDLSKLITSILLHDGERLGSAHLHNKRSTVVGVAHHLSRFALATQTVKNDNRRVSTLSHDECHRILSWIETCAQVPLSEQISNALIPTLLTVKPSTSHKWSIALYENLSACLHFVFEFVRGRDDLIDSVVDCFVKAQWVQLLVSGKNEEVEEDTLQTHTDAKCWALQCLAVSRSATASEASWAMLESAVEGFASASMPVACRLAAVKSIQLLFQAARTTDRVAANSPKLMGSLLKLLFDDDEGVRCQASWAATHLLATYRQGGHCPSTSLDVTSCVVGLVAVLRRSSVSSEARHVVASVVLRDATASEDDEASDDEGDDVLFDSESDNMFVEQRTVETWVRLIAGQLTATLEDPMEAQYAALVHACEGNNWSPLVFM